MKSTHSIIPEVHYPFPKLKIIFENENEKYDNASLYQNILEFADLQRTASGFRFTELGKWLMEKNLEFKKDYSDLKGRTPISARIANKRQRIQNCIDNLEKMDFLHISKMVVAEKNDTMTPLYVITPIGRILSLIVKAKFSTDGEKMNALKEIIKIFNSIKEHNDSAIVLFITELLNQLWINNKESKLIQHFDRLLMLEINSGNDFLSYFLGIKHFLYWFFVDEEISFQILENLQEDKKNTILLNLKTEIEYYYQQNYLLKDDFFKKNFLPISFNNFNYGDLINSGAIPSAYWENTRIKYINSFSKVVVPSYCNVCNSHRAVVVDVADYLKSIRRADDIIPPKPINGNCLECRNLLVINSIFNWLI